jgi:hypothetical protein
MYRTRKTKRGESVGVYIDLAVNNKPEGMCKEEVVSESKILSQLLHERTEEITKT